MSRNLKQPLCLLLFVLVLFMGDAAAKQICKKTIIPTSPASNFILRHDGTVVQNTTGLMWMRCALGQTWEKGTCAGEADSFSWSEALKTAALKSFAGFSDWRLPNKNELESIVEESCISPAINTDVFPATPPNFFWSASPYAGQLNSAWSVDFGFGTVTASDKAGKIHVRLVRDNGDIE